MDRLFSEYTTLQYQNKAMRQELEAFRNGERYKKLQADHHKVVAGYVKEIGRLKKELAKAHAATVTVRDIWFEECDSDWKKYQAELNRKDHKIQKLMDQHWEMLKAYDDRIAAIIKDHEGQLEEKDAVIHGLSARLAHAEALLGRDSTNTSTPNRPNASMERQAYPEQPKKYGEAERRAAGARTPCPGKAGTGRGRRGSGPSSG